MFYVFDGMDGTGKTTQLQLFVKWLENNQHEVDVFRDPGTTELGNRMRELLLNEQGIPIDMRSELLMFMTARAQLTEQCIRPALEAGRTVVCDRYVLSTVVYQGYGGGIDPETVWDMNRFATGGLMPDLTFVMDLEPELAKGRLGEDLDRMESRGVEYFQKLRTGFVKECKRFPVGYELIDANGSIEEIHQRIASLAESFASSAGKSQG